MTKIRCQEALARVYEYLDGELDVADAEAVERHFELCKRCWPELDFARAFQDLMRRVAHGQPACPEPLRAQIAALLQSEGSGPAA